MYLEEFEKLINEGEKEFNKTDFMNAFRSFGKALKLAQENEDQYGIADAYMHLGNVYLFKKQYKFSLESYEKAYEISIAIENYDLLAPCINNLINVYIETQDYERANHLIKKGLDLFNKENDMKRYGILLSNYSSLLFNQKKFEEAELILKSSEESLKDVDLQQVHGNIQYGLGQVYQQMNDIEMSVFHYMRALKIGEQLGFPELAGDSALNLGYNYGKLKNPQKGKEFYIKSLKLYSLCENPKNKWMVERNLRAMGINPHEII